MRRKAYWAGVALQALVLGVLLFFALVGLASLATEARVFHYQGF